MKVQKQIYLNRSIFIDSKTTKITHDYQFIKEIARGMAGIVYQARSKFNPNQLRAIKKVAKNEEQPLHLNQIMCLKELDHPSIIRLFETYEDSENLYYVIDYCEGGQLFDYLEKKQTLAESEVREIFLDMLSAVKYCHEKKIAHRDLKPENFLLLNNNPQKTVPSIKLIDFGLAFKWKESMENELPEQKKNIVGTPYYIAPELLKGKYDEKCDIWSLGVILYIMMTGIPPFNGQSDKEILDKIKNLDYSVEIPEMKEVSLFLKDLIKRILKPANERLSIDKIFKHPWMTVKINKPPIHVDFKVMLNFSKFSKIKTIAATYIASQMAAKSIKSMENLFKQLDHNHDGYIEIDELQEHIKSTKNSEISPEQLRNMMDCLDTDKNGKINYTEFIAGTLDDGVISSNQNMLRVFGMLDKDGNGYVDKDQLLTILNQHGHISQEKLLEDLNEIFATTDLNKDGKIDYDEFVETICTLVG